ncbi:hypothetical protein FFLO_04930 [Filobasidium floriforme]|uniref:Uncharacterized protein n=1 Tax=Filobasidium floriforme TaxID=5210 RepID=A0A8K0JIF8_9TREE|nr:hypothetical protein FFLO_04930 [Filobasidium floriforme]
MTSFGSGLIFGCPFFSWIRWHFSFNCATIDFSCAALASAFSNYLFRFLVSLACLIFSFSSLATFPFNFFSETVKALICLSLSFASAWMI